MCCRCAWPLLLISLPPPSFSASSSSAAVPPEGCQYTRNIGKYREAGPVDANGVPLPAGNVVCYFQSPPTHSLRDFETECDKHQDCVGFSYSASKSPGAAPPALGSGCLKNNYSPKLFPKSGGWGSQDGYEGYDKGRWTGTLVDDWEHTCPCRCAVEWGRPLLLALVFLVACYLGAGAARNRWKNPSATKWALLPHRSFWMGLWGLVLDGVEFTRRAGRYRPVSDGQSPMLGSGRGQERRGGSEPKDEATTKRNKERKKNGKKEKRADATTMDCEQGASSTTLAPANTSSVAAGGGRWIHIPS